MSDAATTLAVPRTSADAYSDGPPRREWLYLRVYVFTLEHVRDLLERVVKPAVAELRAEDSALEWFYLQYADHTGLQLRLRVHSSRERLAVWERSLTDRFLSDAAAGQLQVRLYEPEFAKYGGPDGVSLAERLFRVGSDVGLLLAGERQRSLRIGYGAAHTWLIAMRLSDPIAFCHQYAWYWSGGGARRLPWQYGIDRLRPDTTRGRRAAQAMRSLIDQTLSDTDTNRALTEYADDFWDLVHETASRTGRQAFTEAFDHIHLMNNRLGVVPVEEAHTARLLWLEAASVPA